MISIRERLEARSNDSLDKEATEYIKRLEDALREIIERDCECIDNPIGTFDNIAAQALKKE